MTAPAAPPPWLAVIDMQRVFGEPDSPWFTPRFAEITGAIRQLAGAFAPRVTFTRFIAPAEPQGAWREYYGQWPFALVPPTDRIYELTDEFAADPGPTVDATTFGKWGRELAERTGPAGHLVLAGVSTDCCVLSTALAAADAGIRVTVAADACAGMNDRTHAQALDIMRLYAPLVQVASVAEILQTVPAAPIAR